MREVYDELRLVGYTAEEIDAHFAPEIERFLAAEFGGVGCAHCRANWLASWRPVAASVAGVIGREAVSLALRCPDDRELGLRVEGALYGERQLWACLQQGIISERELTHALIARALSGDGSQWANLSNADQEHFVTKVERALIPWPATHEHAPRT
jgi:hypothetical protein